jgi:hypothetical protein
MKVVMVPVGLPAKINFLLVRAANYVIAKKPVTGIILSVKQGLQHIAFLRNASFIPGYFQPTCCSYGTKNASPNNIVHLGSKSLSLYPVKSG